jgi:hypothetical protein
MTSVPVDVLLDELSSDAILVFVRPEPADGAVRREVVRVQHSLLPPHLSRDADGNWTLHGVGRVNIYSASDLGFDTEFAEELVGLWVQSDDYNRTGTAVEGYDEFLRRFGAANDRADLLVHQALTATQ